MLENRPISYEQLVARKVGGASVRDANTAWERSARKPETQNQETKDVSTAKKFGDVKPVIEAPSVIREREQSQKRDDAQKIAEIRRTLGIGGDESIAETPTPWSEPRTEYDAQEESDIQNVKGIEDVDHVILNEATARPASYEDAPEGPSPFDVESGGSLDR